MIKIVLLGGGGHCKSVIDIISEQKEKYQIEGILDPFCSIRDEILGYPILGNDDHIKEYAENDFQFVITVGQIKTSKIRRQLYHKVKSVGGKLPNIISKQAYVSKFSHLNEGNVIMHNTVLNAESIIGNCNIINTFSSIEHGVKIGDFNHISTKVVLNGDVEVGHDNFIGSGSIVNNLIRIQDNIIISSGSLIRNDISNNTLIYNENFQKTIKNYDK